MLFPSTFPKTTFFFFFFLTSSKLSERGMLTGRMLVLEITAEAGGVLFYFFSFRCMISDHRENCREVAVEGDGQLTLSVSSTMG